MVETYTSDAADKLTSISVGGQTTRSITYDYLGRRKTDTHDGAMSTYTWDQESRITSITRPGMQTHTFDYNGLDTRVSKTLAGNTTTYKRNGASVTDPVMLETTGSVATNHTPGISEKRGTGASTYLHSGIKDADARTSGQTVDASRQYDAFGNLTSSTGTWSGPFGYAGGFGYQEDLESGLKLLGHRYYDSSTGTFLSRDPAGHGRNHYSYCANNPIQYVDIDGLKPKLVIVKGDVSGRGGAVSIPWYIFYAVIDAAFGSTYDIETIVSPTTEEAIIAIAEADEVVFYGHGDDGKIILRGTGKGGKKGGKKSSPDDGEYFQAQDVATMGMLRRRMGKAPLDFAMIFVCDTCAETPMGQEYREAWQEVAAVVLGYGEHTIVEDGLFRKRLGIPKMWPGTTRWPTSRGSGGGRRGRG